VLLLHALALASHFVPVAADICSRDPTDIRISVTIEPPKTDFTKSDSQLDALKAGVAGNPRFIPISGLTLAKIAVNSEVRIANIRTGSGQTCVWPTAVVVTLSTAPEVYVVTNHGKCRTDLAIGHEMQHVAIDREIIDRYSPIFRRRITAMVDAIGTVGPVAQIDLSSVRRRIEEKINAAIAVVGDQMDAERAARQQALDSPSEYARLSLTCPQIDTRSQR